MLPQDEGADDPFSDLVWFYPGACLETGYGILFFWVAHMFMLRIELTGVSTFKVIYGGDIEIVLRSFEKVWYDWLTDIRDW